MLNLTPCCLAWSITFYKSLAILLVLSRQDMSRTRRSRKNLWMWWSASWLLHGHARRLRRPQSNRPPYFLRIEYFVRFKGSWPPRFVVQIVCPLPFLVLICVSGCPGILNSPYRAGQRQYWMQGHPRGGFALILLVLQTFAGGVYPSSFGCAH